MLGDKLTPCLKSDPTGRPKRLHFASLPTGTGRGRRWSALLHLAPLWSLQNLVIMKTKPACTGWFLILFLGLNVMKDVHNQLLTSVIQRQDMKPSGTENLQHKNKIEHTKE